MMWWFEGMNRRKYHTLGPGPRCILALAGILCSGLLLPLSSRAQVVVNEIMANPEGVDTHTEYVELYNTGLLPVDLHSWLIANDEGQDTLYPKPDGTDMLLPAGGYAIILESGYGSDGNELYAGRIPPETLWLAVDDAAIGSGGLTNSIPQTVRLINPSGSTVSARTYRANPPGGVSEEQIDPNGGEGDDNWAFSAQGGTPGYVNSVTPLPHDLTLDTAYVFVPIGRDSLLQLVVRVRNRGTGVSTLGRMLHAQLADTAGILTLADSTTVTALDVGEAMLTGWEMPRLPGGVYTLEVWLMPPDDRPTNDSLWYQTFLPFPMGTLRIVEVMPDPPSSVDVEWVELANRSEQSVDLVEWIFSDAAGTRGRIRGGSIPLLPDSVALLAADSLLLTWPDLPTDAIVLVPGSWPSLNNAGDTLRLYDPSGAVVDEVVYPKASEGLSLQRVIESNTPDAAFWAASPDPNGGSPGRVNPSSQLPGENEKPSVTVSPSPFSPNGDGFEDETVFRFRFPAVQISMTLRLFDRIGRPMGVLLTDRVLPGVSEWVWNGHAGLNSGKLPVGIYVWYVEATNATSGKRWTLKGTLVSAGD